MRFESEANSQDSKASSQNPKQHRYIRSKISTLSKFTNLRKISKSEAKSQIRANSETAGHEFTGFPPHHLRRRAGAARGGHGGHHLHRRRGAPGAPAAGVGLPEFRRRCQISNEVWTCVFIQLGLISGVSSAGVQSFRTEFECI